MHDVQELMGVSLKRQADLISKYVIYNWFRIKKLNHIKKPHQKRVNSSKPVNSNLMQLVALILVQPEI